MRSHRLCAAGFVLLGCGSPAPTTTDEPRPTPDAGSPMAPDSSSESCVEPESLPELPRLGLRRCQGLDPGATTDPSLVGAYPVGVKTITITDPLRPGRSLTTEIWYPADESARGKKGVTYSAQMSDLAKLMGASIPFNPGEIPLVATDAVRDAPLAKADAAAGLVIFSHGFRGMRFQSTFLTVYLASHGYVVAAPDHQGNTMFDGSAPAAQSAVDRMFDVALLTGEMTARARSAKDFFAGSFDPRRIAWMGHSFGASTVIMAGALDNREILTVPLAPAFDDRMAHVYEPPSYDLRGATFLMGGTADTTTPKSHQELAYTRTVAPRYLTLLAGLKHMDFTDVCANDALRLVPQIGSSCGPTTKDHQKTIRTLAVAALHRWVRCDPKADAWLKPGWVGARAGIDAYTSDPGPTAPTLAPEPPVCDVVSPPVAAQTMTLARTNAPSLEVDVTAADPKHRPIVLIHGFGTSRAAFSRQTKALAPRHRMVAFDLRGHGKSGVDPSAPFGQDGLPETLDDPYTAANYAGDVGDVLAALDLKDAVLVGWSSGGQAAILSALGPEKDRIRGLVLVDAAPITRVDPAAHPEYNGGGTLPFAHDIQLGARSMGPWSPVASAFFATPAPQPLLADFLGMVNATPASTRTGQILAPRADLVDALPKVSVPTLVIHGERDDAMLLESAIYLSQHIPNAQLLVFQRSGHAPFAEEPQRFNRTLEKFVSSL